MNNDSKNKNNKLFMGLIIFLIICLASCVVYILVNNGKEEPKPPEEPQAPEQGQQQGGQQEGPQTQQDPSITQIDFEAIRQDLKGRIANNNRGVYIVKCKPTGNGPEKNEEFIRIAPEKLDIVIDKLKTAKSFKSVQTGYEGCPPHNILFYVGGETYYSEKDILIDYGTNDNELMVGYFGERALGGVFTFESAEDIKYFIESLEQ